MFRTLAKSVVLVLNFGIVPHFWVPVLSFDCECMVSMYRVQRSENGRLVVFQFRRVWGSVGLFQQRFVQSVCKTLRSRCTCESVAPCHMNSVVSLIYPMVSCGESYILHGPLILLMWYSREVDEKKKFLSGSVSRSYEHLLLIVFQISVLKVNLHFGVCVCVCACACVLFVCVCVCDTRVKELGPGGPVEGKPSDVSPPTNLALGTMSPQNSDLAMLKTSNVGHRFSYQ